MRYAAALVIAIGLATPTLADGFCPDLEITDIYTDLDTWLMRKTGTVPICSVRATRMAI